MFAVAAGWLPPAPPSPPPPEGWHVLLIHFPVALLLIAPLFILLGALVAARWQGFAVVAALLMILGTAGTWAAVSTGEDARDAIEEASDEALEVLEDHEGLGEVTRNVYTGLTAAYVIFVLLTLVWGPISKAAIRIPLGLIFLVLSAGAALYLAGTAHLGGRLVHEYGIRATLSKTAAPAPDGAVGEAEAEAAERQGEKEGTSAEESAAQESARAAEKPAEEHAEESDAGKANSDEEPAEGETAEQAAAAAEEKPAESAEESPARPPAEQPSEGTTEPPPAEQPSEQAAEPPPATPSSDEPAQEKPASTESPEAPAPGST
ncbi:MAG: hypothetical protein GYA33_08495 [Thermogutta sp.]|nr:hypothetical protein [Thermogutta sp.]